MNRPNGQQCLAKAIKQKTGDKVMESGVSVIGQRCSSRLPEALGEMLKTTKGSAHLARFTEPLPDNNLDDTCTYYHLHAN